MICFDCSNKVICRYYQHFKEAMDIVHLSISHCKCYSIPEEGVKSPVPTKEPLVIAPQVDRMTTGYPDFNSNTKKVTLEVVKEDVFVKEPEYFMGVCQFCGEEKEIYTCECGAVCCEDCGMPPYCKKCWEEQ